MSHHVAASNVLSKIAETARKRVKEAQSHRSFALIQDEWRAIRPKPKDFTKAFINPWNVIAEVKKASPSQGDIAPEVDTLEVAKEYLNNGAAALSVLTEPFFFKGKIDYLKEIRAGYPESYILQKDFVVDAYQIYEAALIGADAVLLIVAMLGEEETKRLNQVALDLGLTVLMEVHDREELEIAKRMGSRLIGVNNRNLKDMSISLETSRELIKFMPADAIAIAESGLRTHADLIELKALGYKGFLVGTQLMESGRPGKALRELCGYAD